MGINKKEHGSKKVSLFQKLNSNFSTQNINISNQSGQNVTRQQNNLSQLGVSLSKKTSTQSISKIQELQQHPVFQHRQENLSKRKENSMRLSINTQVKTEGNESRTSILSPGQYNFKPEETIEKNNNGRRSILFKLQQMINEDKIYFDKKSPDSTKQKTPISLQISQDGLVRHKNPGIERQNTMLQRRATQIDQQKEISTPKNNSNGEFPQNFFFNFGSASKASFTDLQGQRQNNSLNLPNISIPIRQSINLSNYSPQNKSDLASSQNFESKSQFEQPEDLLKLCSFQDSPNKKKSLTDFDKAKLKRRQHESRIYNEFEPRLKTFTKFGFKMMEKEENEYLRPFMREVQANEPKGTMFVSDLWSDQNILKFLGNCKMIRDKLTLIKLAQKQQSRENLLKKINNSNQLYFSNGRISQQNISTISQIMKLIYKEPIKSGNNNQSRSPIDPRESILLGQSIKKLDILNRKEELNLINSIHMNEMRKSIEKKAVQELMQPFLQTSNSKQRSSIIGMQQENLSTRLSKPKSEVPPTNKFDQFLKQQTTIFKNRRSMVNLKQPTLNNKAQSLGANMIQIINQEDEQNQNKFKPLQLFKKNENIGDLSALQIQQRKISSILDYQVSTNTHTKHQIKLMGWIGEIDQVIKDNDKMYEKLNKHIDKLQDVIIKRNDKNEINV